jgi:hypothetical protein
MVIVRIVVTEFSHVRNSRLALGAHFIISLVNPEQMLPGSIVTIKSEALRDLEARWNTALDCLIAFSTKQ